MSAVLPKRPEHAILYAEFGAPSERGVELSITKTRDFFEKSGCGKYIMGAFGLALIVGLLWTGFGSGNQQPEQEKNYVQAAAVGNHAVQVHEIEMLLEELNKAQQGSSDPLRAAAQYGGAVYFTVQNAVEAYLAEKAGIQLSDERIRSLAEEAAADQAKAQTENSKMQMAALGILKPGYTEADFAAEFKKQQGISPSEYQDQMKQQMLQALEDPTQKSRIVAGITREELLKKYSNSITLSDEDLKRSYERFTVKRVYVDPRKEDPLKPKDAEALAKVSQALSAVKGGMSFEAAMDKYSDDPVPPGKKSKGESQLFYERYQLENDRNLRPILNLKPGLVSGVLNSSGGPAIFKLIKVETNLPKDFETQKKTRYEVVRQNMAANKAADEVLKIYDGETINWKIKGFQAVFEWQYARTDNTIQFEPVKRRERLLKAYESAQAALKEGDAFSDRPGKFAEFGAYEDLWAMSDDAQKAKLKEDRPVVLEHVLSVADGPELRVELGKILIAKKDLEGAIPQIEVAAQQMFVYDDATLARYKEMLSLRKQLKDAGAADEMLKGVDDAIEAYKAGAFEVLKGLMETNLDYSEQGQKLYNDTYRQLDRLKKLGFISAEQGKQIENLLNKWRTEKIKADKEAKAAIEQARKEEEQRTKEEAAKAKGSGGASNSTTPPKTGDFGIPNPAATDSSKGGAKSGTSEKPKKPGG